MKTSAVLMAIIVIESTISIFMLLAKKMFTASQKTRPAANPRTRADLLASCAIRASKQYRPKANGTIVNVMASVLNDTLAEQHQRLGKRHREGGEIVPAFFHGYDQKH